VPQRVLNARWLVDQLRARIPEELTAVYDRLRDEEVGSLVGTPPPLTDYGRAAGFGQEQQARASGATQVRDVCAILHLTIRQLVRLAHRSRS
jgi:hypothetical protein